MGGHGHHEPAYKVPDYKIYKVEDCPELVKLQKRLAEKGLSDPWLRNEVWRFKASTPTLTIARMFLFRGFGVGLGLLGLTVLYTKLTSKDDGHGHGHEHH